MSQLFSGKDKVSQVRKKSLACDTYLRSVRSGVAGGEKNADLRRFVR